MTDRIRAAEQVEQIRERAARFHYGEAVEPSPHDDIAFLLSVLDAPKKVELCDVCCNQPLASGKDCICKDSGFEGTSYGEKIGLRLALNAAEEAPKREEPLCGAKTMLGLTQSYVCNRPLGHSGKHIWHDASIRTSVPGAGEWMKELADRLNRNQTASLPATEGQPMRTGYMRHVGPWKCIRCPFEVPYDSIWGVMSDAIEAHYAEAHPNASAANPAEDAKPALPAAVDYMSECHKAHGLLVRSIGWLQKHPFADRCGGGDCELPIFLQEINSYLTGLDKKFATSALPAAGVEPRFHRMPEELYDHLKQDLPRVEATQEKFDNARVILAATRLQLEEMRQQRFAPLGDNHHNAAACPHCNPQFTENLKRAESAESKLEQSKKAVARLTECLRKANEGFEEYERKFYLERAKLEQIGEMVDEGFTVQDCEGFLLSGKQWHARHYDKSDVDALLAKVGEKAKTQE